MARASRGEEARYLAADVLEFLQRGPETWRAAEETLDFLRGRMVEGVAFRADQVRLLAPILNPSKIVASGLNYLDHCREQNIEPPARPTIFTKFPSSLIGPDAPITWSPALTQQVDYEAELGVVIGKSAKNVSAANALNYVFGYTILNDVSARDLQFGDQQWIRGKSQDTFCPLGPAIVSKDEVGDPQNLHVRCRLNGQVMQDSNTREMIAGVARLIEFITEGITLLPGDVIATGTPHGVGVFRKPPVFMKPGDVVEVEIERLGRLANPVE
jgi:2-keto-4-pentenoate hydratase/2-oxohepta-3-ene-1,7-dioic acid hydratase in catechol pathway